MSSSPQGLAGPSDGGIGFVETGLAVTSPWNASNGQQLGRAGLFIGGSGGIVLGGELLIGAAEGGALALGIVALPAIAALSIGGFLLYEAWNR